MKPYCLTPAAEDDVFEIWSRIAAEGLPVADRIELKSMTPVSVCLRCLI